MTGTCRREHGPAGGTAHRRRPLAPPAAAAGPAAPWALLAAVVLAIGLAPPGADARQAPVAEEAAQSDEDAVRQEGDDGRELFGVGAGVDTRSGPANPLSSDRGREAADDAAGAEGARSGEAGRDGRATGDLPAGDDRGGEAEAEQAQEEGGLLDAENFIPSEEIRVDTAITFPVDI